MARKDKVTAEIPQQIENEQGAAPATTPPTDGATPAPGEGADEEPAKRKVARHWLIDANGNKVEDEESATGIGYQVLGASKEFTFQIGRNADADRMLAIFGAKTLATNESSAARNGKDSADAEGQMDAVSERFALLGTGKWVDRTREGAGGAKVDKDALAAAIVAVAESAGKAVDYAAIRQKLEEDPAFVRATRQVPAIATEYANRAGRPAKSLDDVLAGIA